jgi:hypothetical protein
MKRKITLILAWVFAASMGHAQMAYMEYVAVKNTDVAAHIAAEKNIFSKAHKEQIDKGNKLGWDMWMIENNSYGEPNTTFVYVHFNKPGTTLTYNDSNLFSAYESTLHQSGYHNRIVKTGQLTLGIKASYGTKAGAKPPKYLVANYMTVDLYDGAAYEAMELKYGPNYAENGQAAWGFGKVLNRFGADQDVNYLTFDFYNSMEEILEMRNNTASFTKAQLTQWKSMDKLRTLKNSHIMTLIASER